MTSMLFFKGSGSTPARAIGRAGAECASLLQENPCLMVELVELTQTGQMWNAHIRVMALEGAGEQGSSGTIGKPPQKDYTPKNPEHAISGDPDAWHPPGMKHDPSSIEDVEKSFDTASLAGQIPDIPVRDIVMLRQEGLSEDQVTALRNVYVNRAIRQSSRTLDLKLEKK